MQSRRKMARINRVIGELPVDTWPPIRSVQGLHGKRIPASDRNQCGIRLNLHLLTSHSPHRPGNICTEISAIIYLHSAHGDAATGPPGVCNPTSWLPTAHALPWTRTCTIYAKNSVRAAARRPTAEYPDSIVRKYERVSRWTPIPLQIHGLLQRYASFEGKTAKRTRKVR